MLKHNALHDKQFYQDTKKQRTTGCFQQISALFNDALKLLACLDFLLLRYHPLVMAVKADVCVKLKPVFKFFFFAFVP